MTKFRPLLGFVLRRLNKSRPVPIRDPIVHHHNGNYQNSVIEITVIIPTRDNTELLRKAISSLKDHSINLSIEIIVIDNGSQELVSAEYFHTLRKQGIKVIRIDEDFNYSRLCNAGIDIASHDLICLMNNDVELRSPNWAHNALDHLRDGRVALVGARLEYPTGELQHIGLMIGLGGVAGHLYRGSRFSDIFWLEENSCFTASGVSFAFVVFRKNLLTTVGFLDENLPVGFNDVDYCLRVREEHLTSIVCTRIIGKHVESATRPSLARPRGFIQGLKDTLYMLRKWKVLDFTDDYFVSK